MFRVPALIAAAILSVTPALADRMITVEDAYARSASPMAKTGAAFMMIANSGAEDDQLVEVRSDVAMRVELHTHLSDTNGTMRMVEVEDGFTIPAGGSHTLARGGDHVMFMGLKAPFEQNATIPLTLVFEQAGEIEIEIEIDNERRPES